MKLALITLALLAYSASAGTVLSGWKLQKFDAADENCTGSVLGEYFVPDEFCSADFVVGAGKGFGSTKHSYTMNKQSLEISYQSEFFLGVGCNGNPVVTSSVEASVWFGAALRSCISFNGNYWKAVDGTANSRDLFTSVKVSGKTCASLGAHTSLASLIASVEVEVSGEGEGPKFTAAKNLKAKVVEPSPQPLVVVNLGSELYAAFKGSCQATSSGTASYKANQGGEIQWYTGAECSGEVVATTSCRDEGADSTSAGSLESAESSNENAPSSAFRSISSLLLLASALAFGLF